MKLTLEGLHDREAWEKAGIQIPSYDVEKSMENAKENPCWVHFGIGNIFRIFLGTIAEGLLEQGIMDRGITCVETFDFDVVDQIYKPYDNLALSVILKKDGTREYRVLGALSEVIKANTEYNRLREVFASKSLQMVSFTITEKGYALTRPDNSYLPFVQADIDNGPEHPTGAMGIIVSMLLQRYKAGKYPLALVSMDNCSRNGETLRKAVLQMAGEWEKKGFVDADFMDYISDEATIAFPWTMIDKITPRPSESIADDLEALGVESMQPVITGKRTYIAPFINAEKPQYLVIEDSFPNGRPALEKGFGVYIADRDTVNLAERMKVTACLNPVHTALGPIGVVLGIPLFADLLDKPELLKLGRDLVYKEGMPITVDPKIISMQAFADELFDDRFPNKFLGDTNLRLSTDVSQMEGVRFGETTKAYVAKDGTAESLTALPLGVAGWLRYLLGVDDNLNAFEMAPDPMAEQVKARLADIVVGKPETFTDQLKWILSNETIFFVNFYEAGLGEKIEQMFREMIAGPGAVDQTIRKYMLGE